MPSFPQEGGGFHSPHKERPASETWPIGESTKQSAEHQRDGMRSRMDAQFIIVS